MLAARFVLSGRKRRHTALSYLLAIISGVQLVQRKTRSSVKSSSFTSSLDVVSRKFYEVWRPYCDMGQLEQLFNVHDCIIYLEISGQTL